MYVFLGILIPLFGTSLGAAMVFFMNYTIKGAIEKLLLGFAAGVMIAASIWSLLLPSIEMAEKENIIAWIPASVGFLAGIVSLLIIHRYISDFSFMERVDNPDKFKKTIMMVLAVTLHNIPEGMAVGTVFASVLSGNNLVTMAGAFSLAIGIAIQNFPEGAIISMPLRERGFSKWRCFWYGSLSGIVEPLGAIITILLTSIITKILPYLLSFAAGAMIFVVVDELIPESQDGNHSNYGLIGVTIGFVLMMILDVAFG